MPKRENMTVRDRKDGTNPTIGHQTAERANFCVLSKKKGMKESEKQCLEWITKVSTICVLK